FLTALRRPVRKRFLDRGSDFDYIQKFVAFIAGRLESARQFLPKFPRIGKGIRRFQPRSSSALASKRRAPTEQPYRCFDAFEARVFCRPASRLNLRPGHPTDLEQSEPFEIFDAVLTSGRLAAAGFNQLSHPQFKSF